MIYKYVLLKGEKSHEFINELIDQNRIDPDDTRELRRTIEHLIQRLTEGLKFYNAYENASGSLTDRVQVTISGPSDETVYVIKATAADYNFRNLKFKNVLVNLDSKTNKFVFPVNIKKLFSLQHKISKVF